MAASAASYATELLRRQFLEMSKSPPEGISVGLKDDNIFTWEVMIIGPAGTMYEGGFFRALLTFPEDFPSKPPEMQFLSKMWHPNVYPDGKVCISILHPPGTDKFNEMESADERWRPILGVEQILMSVISLFADPNDESPANIDAAVMWRERREEFKKEVRKIVDRSMEDM
mmetsp:Transcript_44348/g.123361  ORF Transcript_44348/g.123361 Transcript_44348/m.123361 type:complete len:171 (-) Transcript_44348:243-755(-)